VSVSCESEQQSRKDMSAARDGPLLSHNPYKLLDYVFVLYSGRLNSISSTNSTFSSKRCFSSSRAKSRRRRFT